MVQFRGRDDSSSVRILNKEKLRYAKIPFIRLFVGLILFALGTFCGAFLLEGISAKLGWPTQVESNVQILVMTCLFAGIAIIIWLVTRKLYNWMFIKEVSLIDLGDDSFKLIVGKETYLYKKTDIIKAKAVRNIGKGRMINEGWVKIKMKDRSFRFTSESHYSAISSLAQHLNDWKNKQ